MYSERGPYPSRKIEENGAAFVAVRTVERLGSSGRIEGAACGVRSHKMSVGMC